MITAMLRHPLQFHRDHRLTRAHASAFLDGELDAEQRARVEQHTHLCPPCARLIASLRQTVAALGALRTEEPTTTDSVTDGILHRLREDC